MKIVGLQKLTLLDFPGKTAATVFTPGCNLRCPFCHNSELALHTSTNELEDMSEDVYSFLDKRQGLLDGICITGGEPLLQKGLIDFCKNVKEKGFDIKLDTNGFFPDRLKELIESSYIDYVALDVKNSKARYPETVGIKGIDTTPFFESLDYLLQKPLPYEFRTTLVREFHDKQSLIEAAQLLKGAESWFLQSFVDSPQVLAGQNTLHSYSGEELQELLEAVQAYVPQAELRGV